MKARWKIAASLVLAGASDAVWAQAYRTSIIFLPAVSHPWTVKRADPYAQWNARSKNAPGQQIDRVTDATFRVAYPKPDDWHRLALFGNWDFIDHSVWRTIVTEPDCDRATALAIFWKAFPEYYAEFANRAAVPVVNRDDYDLIVLIRDRWEAGAYSRAELAFDPDTDAWPVDRDALRRRYGKRVDQLMPPDMRVQLQGRRLSNENFKPGVIN